MSELHSRSQISKLARNSLWAGLGSYVGLVFAPVTALITTRFLGVEDYGVYSVIQNWGTLLSAISGLGLIGANLRLIPQYKGEANEKAIKGSIKLTVGIVACISTVTATLVFIFPDRIISLLLKKSNEISSDKLQSLVIPAFQFYIASIVLTNLYQVAISSINGLQFIRYKVIANDILGPLSKTVFLIVFLFFGFGIYGALGANLIQDFTIGVVAYFLLFKSFPGLRNKALTAVYQFKRHFKFGITLFVNSLLYKYVFQLDILFLGYYGFLNTVGVYAVAQNLQKLIYMPSYAITTIFGPMCGEMYAKKDVDGIQKLYKVATKWATSISMPVFTILTMFAYEILNLFGKDFTAGVEILVLIGVANLIVDGFGLAGVIILSTGKAYLNLINSIGIATVNIILYNILIPKFGIYGAAWAYLTALIVVNSARLLEVWYLYRIHPFSFELFKPLLACAISAGFVLLIEKAGYGRLIDMHYGFAFLVLVFIIIYIVVTIKLKVNEDDKIFINIFREKFNKKNKK